MPGGDRVEGQSRAARAAPVAPNDGFARVREPAGLPDAPRCASATRTNAMPFRIHVDTAHRVLMVVAYGLGTLDGSRAAVAAVVNHPVFAAGSPVLLDLQQVQFTPSWRQVQSLAEPRLRRVVSGRRLAVLSRAGLQAGVAAMIATAARDVGWSVSTFVDRDAAMEWLTAGAWAID